MMTSLPFIIKYPLYVLDFVVLVYYYDKLFDVWKDGSKLEKTGICVIFAALALCDWQAMTAIVFCIYAAFGKKYSLQRKLSSICIMSIACCWSKIFFEVYYYWVDDMLTDTLYEGAMHVGFWLMIIGLSHWKMKDMTHSILNLKLFYLLASVPILSLVWNVFSMYYWTSSMTDSMMQRNNLFYHFPICTLFIIFDIVICYIYFAMEKRQTEMRSITQREAQLRLQLDQYEKMKRMHQHILSVRHDVNNNLSSLYTLLRTNKIEDAEHLLRGLIRRFEDVQFIEYTGNGVIDSIINLELEKARIQHIQMEVTAAIPSDICIDPEKITTILGNLLDNAIEACKDIQGAPQIHLNMYYLNYALMIQVKNTWKPDKAQRGSRIINEMNTTKQDKTHHGFGLQNVASAVEQLGGSIDIHAEDPWFFVRIILYNQCRH